MLTSFSDHVVRVKLYLQDGRVIKTNDVRGCDVNVNTEYMTHQRFGYPDEMRVPINTETTLSLSLGEVKIVDDKKSICLNDEGFQNLKRKLDRSQP